MKVCKECAAQKTDGEFYHHPKTKDGLYGRCKECVKRGRKSERERSIARKYDNARANRPERVALRKKITKRFRKANPEKWKAECAVNNFFRKRPDLKPTASTISGATGRLHMHHPDYSRPNEIIPCTPIEHRALHSGKIAAEARHVVQLPF